MKVIIYDSVCKYAPYTAETLLKSPMGGTEATIIRIAEALDVNVIQPARKIPEGRYLPDQEEYWNGCDIVICVRDPISLSRAQSMAPKARIFLWCHDHPPRGSSYIDLLAEHIQKNITIIAVSEYHKSYITKLITIDGKHQLPGSITRIYNPIDDNLNQDTTIEVDNKKLIFFSSPHKGIELTLKTFKEIRKVDPDFTLYISNPGYFRSKDTSLEDGVINIGSLPHAEVISHVRSALCTFHMNNVAEETFGIVYAESNAVGTPFLTHPIGSVPELTSLPYQFIDCDNTNAVIERVLAWSNKERPSVSLDSKFRMSAVLEEWKKLLYH